MDQGRCCTADNPCVVGEGDCDEDAECEAGLVCGENNCRQVSGQSEAGPASLDQSEHSVSCSSGHSSMKRTTVV